MPQEDHDLESARKLSGTLARVLREISRDYDKRITAGVQARGHPDIRASHQVVFSNIGLGRPRVTELARRAQVTQQAMGKTLKELELLGYVERAVDSSDRRARAIRLTDRGLQVIEDSLAAAREVQACYRQQIGKRELRELEANLRRAARKLELDFLPANWADPPGDT